MRFGNAAETIQSSERFHSASLTADSDLRIRLSTGASNDQKSAARLAGTLGDPRLTGEGFRVKGLGLRGPTTLPIAYDGIAPRAA